MRRKWNSTVIFRDILGEYDNNAIERDEVKRIRILFIERLKSYPELKIFAKDFNRVTSRMGFNQKLNILFDYCDTFGIWVE